MSRATDHRTSTNLPAQMSPGGLSTRARQFRDRAKSVFLLNAAAAEAQADLHGAEVIDAHVKLYCDINADTEPDVIRAVRKLIDEETISVVLHFTHDEATALACLTGRMDETACAQFARCCTIYGALCRPEAAVIVDAMAAVCSALGVTGFMPK